MNYPDNSTVNTTAKKIRFSSATRALFLGLVLALPGLPALAASNPIPGIDIIVQKKPGGIIINAPTGADGTFQFKGLAAGNYDLSVGGKRVQTLRVGSDGSIKGVLSRQPDGKASIAFNGQVGVVPDEAQLKSFEDLAVKHERRATVPGPGAVGDYDGDGKEDISRTNPNQVGGRPSETSPTFNKITNDREKKNAESTGFAAISGKGMQSESSGPQFTAPHPLDVGNASEDGLMMRYMFGLRGIANAIEPQPDNVLPGAAISTTRSNIKRPGIAVGDLTGDGKEDISRTNPNQAGGRPSETSYRVTNDRENKNAEPTGTGSEDSLIIRYLFGLTGSSVAIDRDDRRGGITINPVNDSPSTKLDEKFNSSFNNSRSDIKSGGINDREKKNAEPTGIEGKNEGGVSLNKPIVGMTATPIVALPIMLESVPGNIKFSAITNSNGDFHFDNLPAGRYKFSGPDMTSQAFNVAADGNAGGKVMRGNDGDINIFDRWGTLLASSGGNTDNIPAGNMVAKKPGFEPPGSGFAGMGGGGPGILPGMGLGGPGPGPVGPSPGVMSPGPSPMSPGPMGAGPAGPGAGAMRR